MYIGQGQGQILPGDKRLIVTKKITTLITRYKFRPLVVNAFWENYFSTFP